MGVNTTVMVAVGGWMFLKMQSLKADMRQQRQDLLDILQGHTHSEEGAAVFHQLTAITLVPSTFPCKPFPGNTQAC